MASNFYLAPLLETTMLRYWDTLEIFADAPVRNFVVFPKYFFGKQIDDSFLAKCLTMEPTLQPVNNSKLHAKC